MPTLPPKPPHFYAVDHVRAKGRWYSYFGRTLRKKPTIRIKPAYHDDPAGFRQAYGKLLSSHQSSSTVEGVQANTLADYAGRYLRSAHFASLAQNTQGNQRRLLRYLVDDYGNKSMAKLSERAVGTIIDDNRRPDTVVNQMVKMLSILAKRAVRDGILSANPVPSVDRRKVKTANKVPWPLNEREKFRARWPLGTKQRTAFEIGFYTAQRGNDVCAAQWAHFDVASWRLTQAKTGRVLTLPVRPGLRQALDATPKDGMFVIGTSRGARSPKSFYNWFRSACDEAGVDRGLTFHGLRATAAVAAIQADCTEDEAMALTGHTDRGEFQRYVRGAQQDVLASKAVAKLENTTRTDNVKPAENVKQTGKSGAKTSG